MVKLILVLIAIIIVVIVKYIQLKREVKAKAPKNQYLIETGIVLSVKPEEISVKSRSYWEEKESEVSNITMANALYDKERNFSQEQQFSSVLIYEGCFNNRPVKYVSPAINMDEVTLRYRLLNVQEVRIYVDKKNDNNYLFDLRFL